MLNSKVIIKKGEHFDEYKKIIFRFFADGINPTLKNIEDGLKERFSDRLNDVSIKIIATSFTKRFLYRGLLKKTNYTDEQGIRKYRIDDSIVNMCTKTSTIVSLEPKYKPILDKQWITKRNRTMTQDDIDNTMEDIKNGKLKDFDDDLDEKQFEKEQKAAEQMSL